MQPRRLEDTKKNSFFDDAANPAFYGELKAVSDRGKLIS